LFDCCIERALAEPKGHEHATRPLAPVPEAGYRRAAAVFRAVGDVERLRLLTQIAHGEWCVTELAAATGASLSTVSQRLRVLRNEALVDTRRDGKHVYYSLADDHVARLVDNALAHASETPTQGG
jgi:ArsR family transcriptional regulator, lead/cadmium/zinc/bismuth-responsive transcriptional repressor